MSPVVLEGPCESGLNIKVDGDIVAPEGSSKYKGQSGGTVAFLHLRKISNLQVFGSGTIDGRGKGFWGGSGKRPMLVYMQLCNDSSISGVTLRNAGFFHLFINKCARVGVVGVTTDSPVDSRNTDGIHLSFSSHVVIDSCALAGGDDNIALWDGCRDIRITNVTILSGNGISIGALGSKKAGPTSCVSDVTVKTARFIGTKIGLRIKTIQGGVGAAANIAYDDITMDGVRYPLVLDQFYDKGSLLSRSSAKSKNIAIYNVAFSNIKGTTIGSEGIIFRCSKSNPCTSVTMKNVDISSTDGDSLKPVSENLFGDIENVSVPLTFGDKADGDTKSKVKDLMSSCEW
eukprot:TRINITY_DN30349_c0_g3_i2.p1 TRINITY_DN30349_c0_g3~~TRINITY_DN30349_c0_g3_i2.p1  ORF type:complete len:385 (-),score=35.18 TRINITY_DN30349_c0_g3_i2:172-1203(-)